VKHQTYFLDRDNSCHWYLIPSERRSEWDCWTNLDETDPKSWDHPTWAVRLDGGPQGVTFSGPVEDMGKRIDGVNEDHDHGN